MDRFQELLWDLGELLELPLHVDKNHACRILIKKKLSIHMEMVEERDALLLAAFLAEIPPGRFRENVLRESLKVNATHHTFGTLAYIEKINTLVMHRYIPAATLTGEKLAEILEGFIVEADQWREAIQNGQAAPSEYLKTHGGQPSPYSIPPQRP